MPFRRNQSKIAQVRDEMSLDYASGRYLNAVTSNLGLDRPPFGFDDDLWRAVAKLIALDYKQIANKFRDLLNALYGPSRTFTSVLAQDTVLGQEVIFLKNVDGLPQLGTLVLDEGVPNSAEVAKYRFIDRTNKAVFLNSPIQLPHKARSFEAEGVVYAFSQTGTSLLLDDTSKFPTSDFPYPIVVGRGTPAEEVAMVIGNDVNVGELHLVTALSNTTGLPSERHTLPSSTPTMTELRQDYAPDSFFIALDSVKTLPQTGHLLLGAVGSYTATGGTTSSVELAGGTFTPDKQIGNIVVFDGNVTAGLAGQEVVVLRNSTPSDDVLEFVTPLPVAPVAGDTFSVRARTPYTRVSLEDAAVILPEPIEDLVIPQGTLVELLKVRTTASLATVQFKGTGWDVLQATPKVVELYIPEELQDASNVRTASYLHTTASSPQPTTAISSAVSTGAVFIDVTSTADFPTVGVLTVGSTRYGYKVASATTFELTRPTVESYLLAEPVFLYQPAHAGTDVLTGNWPTVPATFPGPYVYDVFQPAPTASVANTSLTTVLPGPTFLSISQVTNATALEVDNAAPMLYQMLPTDILIGSGTGNRETATVLDVNLRTRAVGTELSASTSVGDTVLPVNQTSNGPALDGADFPDANGYRILIARGQANEEVAYVIGTTSNSITVESPLLNAHNTNDTVELMADVLTVNPLGDSHTGFLPRPLRSTATDASARWPAVPPSAVEFAELVNPLLSSIDIVDAQGFSTNGGRVLLNFGYNQVFTRRKVDSAVTVGDTSLVLTDTSTLPTTSEFIVLLGEGTAREEWAIVSANDGVDTLTLPYGTKYDHDVDESVVWFPGGQEVLTYSSITGNTIGFSTPVMLQFTHYPSELVVGSSSDSIPRQNGYDFPLRMPPSSRMRLRYLLDLIRAAGIQVDIIDKR